VSLKPRKTSTYDYDLLPVIVIFAILALVLWIAPADASMADCMNATFRITASDGGLGTGVAYEIKEGKVYVLTNAHVATSDIMHMELWRRGHKSRKMIGRTILRHENADVAVIALDVALFQGKLPSVIPLASPSYRLEAGQTIASVGCARGAWPTAWIGNVIGTYPKDDDIAFNPFPARGRSGSGVFNAECTKIVALVHIQANVGTGETPAATVPENNFGTAVNISRIHAALRGERMDTEFSLSSFMAFPAPAQCGPRSCPPSNPVLPYRQKQEYRYKQQDERDKRQDRRLDDLFPTLPPLPPELEVPPLEFEQPDDGGNIHESKGPDLPPSNSILLVGLFLAAVTVGGLTGLVQQWKKTHKRQ